MNFYLLNGIPHVDPHYCFLDSWPEGTGAFTYRMAEGMRMGDKYPKAARQFMDAEHVGTGLPDFIGNTNSFLIVSRRMKEVIEAMVQWEIEYLPFDLYDHKKKLASQDYFIINPIGAFDGLNLQKSVIEWHEGDIVGIDKFVLDKKKLEKAPHLFRIKEAPREYVMSQALALEFKKHQFTNIYSWELEQA